METTYDEYGMPTQINDLGDLATTEDDRCTRIEYVRNESRYIVGTVQRSETVARACSAGAVGAADVIEETRNSYDGGGYGAAPTRGLVTQVERLRGHAGSTPQFVAEARSTYDAYGRVLSVTDALGRVTRTSYTPSSGGPVTGTATTSPDPVTVDRPTSL